MCVHTLSALLFCLCVCLCVLSLSPPLSPVCACLYSFLFTVQLLFITVFIPYCVSRASVSSKRPLRSLMEIENPQSAYDTDPDKIKLFVGQVPKEYDEEQIKALLEEFGPIHEINIIKDKEKRSKGLPSLTEGTINVYISLFIVYHRHLLIFKLTVELALITDILSMCVYVHRLYTHTCTVHAYMCFVIILLPFRLCICNLLSQGVRRKRSAEFARKENTTSCKRERGGENEARSIVTLVNSIIIIMNHSHYYLLNQMNHPMQVKPATQSNRDKGEDRRLFVGQLSPG